MLIKRFPAGPIMTNSYLAIDEKDNIAFIVDAGGYSQQLTDEVKARGADLMYIILTHGHADHTAGVEEYLKDFPNAKVVVSDSEKAFIKDHVQNGALEMYRREVVLIPDIYVHDNDELAFGDMKLKIITTPGHTEGGISILAGNALFSGDTLFRTSIGRTDLQGGSFETLMRSIKDKLFHLPDDTDVYPGHMDPTTIGFEKRNNPFV